MRHTVLILYCSSVMISQKHFHLSAAHAFYCWRWRARHYRVVQVFGVHVAASSIHGQNDHLACKLDFHSPCGSHYNLLVKKQLCHCVHHRASTNRDTDTIGSEPAR